MYFFAFSLGGAHCTASCIFHFILITELAYELPVLCTLYALFSLVTEGGASYYILLAFIPSLCAHLPSVVWLPKDWAFVFRWLPLVWIFLSMEMKSSWKHVHVIWRCCRYRHQFFYCFHIHLGDPKNLIQYIFWPVKKLFLQTNLKGSFHLLMRSMEGRVISKSEDYINIFYSGAR